MFISLKKTANLEVTVVGSYANSVLQALYFCSPFRDLVLQSIDASASSTSSAPASLAAPPMLRRQSGKRAPSEATSSTAQDDQATIPVHPPTLFSALRSLFMYISKHPAEKGTVAPRAFVDKLKSVNELFQGTQHQDAHEFLNYLLNKIVEEIQTDRNHKDGPLDESHDDRTRVYHSYWVVAHETLLSVRLSGHSFFRPCADFFE